MSMHFLGNELLAAGAHYARYYGSSHDGSTTTSMMMMAVEGLDGPCLSKSAVPAATSRAY